MDWAVEESPAPGNVKVFSANGEVYDVDGSGVTSPEAYNDAVEEDNHSLLPLGFCP